MKGLAIPDDARKEAIVKIYNKWFLKWCSKGSNITDQDFERIIAEMNWIADRYPQFPLVRELLVVFLHELEARAHGGYTDLSLISWNQNEGFERIGE